MFFSYNEPRARISSIRRARGNYTEGRQLWVLGAVLCMSEARSRIKKWGGESAPPSRRANKKRNKFLCCVSPKPTRSRALLSTVLEKALWLVWSLCLWREWLKSLLYNDAPDLSRARVCEGVSILFFPKPRWAQREPPGGGLVWPEPVHLLAKRASPLSRRSRPESENRDFK